MVDVLLFDPLERALWLLVIVKDAIAGPFFIYRGYKTKIKSERLILYGFGLFLLISFFLGFIALYLNRFFIEGYYINHSYYFDFNENLFFESFLNVYYYVFSFMSYIGMFLFIFLLEKAIKSTKYLLSLVYLMFEVFTIIDINFGIFTSFYAGYVIISIFTWFSIKSSKRFQLTTVFLIIGINIGNISSALIATIYNTGLPPSLSPALYLLSGLFVFLPLFVNLDVLIKSRTSIQWILLIISNCIMQIFMLFYMFLLPIHIGVIGWFYTPNFLIPIIIGIKQLNKDRKVKKLEIPKELEVRKDEFQEIVKIFTKRRKLTEEEVTVSKEKQICIVCKNEILKANYICPECKTFYCLKCSIALTESENACWVCDTPFDASKPSKPSKEEVEGKEEKDADIIDGLKTLKK